jgi:prepilin-type N-terminal cleavage/methylation domain-containing protein
MKCQLRCWANGFTLSELLIALGILGLLSVFAIPKVLETMSGNTLEAHKRKGQEAAQLLTGAYARYKADKRVTASTKGVDFLEYLNYVRTDTSGATVDEYYGWGTVACDSSRVCYRLNNGGVFIMDPTEQFAGTDPTGNAVAFLFDPDGKVTAGGGVNTAGKATRFILHYNGKITTWAEVAPGSANSNTVSWGAYVVSNPPWFSWD